MTGKLSLSLCLALFLNSVCAAEFNFVKGQRSAKDIADDQLRKGPEIVAIADVKAGMIIADVLGGGGYYSEILNSLVGPNGKVYLHNNKAYMPYVEKELVARLANNRLEHVIRHDRETDALDFTANNFDVMFFVLGYHDLYHTSDGWSVNKDDFIKQVTTALKAKGKLVIVDHSAKAGSGIEFSQELHRIDKQYVINELQSKGFKLLKESNLLANTNDDLMGSPFKPELRRKTDRFVLVFEKR